MRKVSEEFYSLSATTQNNTTFDFKSLKGHPVLIANTATQCGLAATAFRNMRALAVRYPKMRVLIFPCGQFFNQEGGGQETENFLKLRHIEGGRHAEGGIEEVPGTKPLKEINLKIDNQDEKTENIDKEKNKDESNQSIKSDPLPENITIFQKVNVFGSSQHPVFKFLTSNLKGTFTNTIKWNFTKFLVDENGIPSKRYGPNEAVEIDDKLIKNMLPDEL